jgi:hypothetical protein
MKKEKEPFTFYKLSTVVVNRLGVEAACVHAVIRNRSQTEGYVCELSNSTIGNSVHMSYRRVAKCISVLLANRFIKPAMSNTNYQTKAYQYVPDMVDHELKIEEMVTLKCNDARIAEHRKNKQKKKGDSNRITDTNTSNDTGHHTSCDESTHPDDTNHVTSKGGDVTNSPPIKNYKEFNKEINKEMGSGSLSSKSNRIEKIRELFESRLRINCEGDKWEALFEYVDDRQENHKQNPSTFVTWLLKNDFEAKYWPPERMKTCYPQAFKEIDDFLANCVKPRDPSIPEEECVPMPKDLLN